MKELTEKELKKLLGGVITNMVLEGLVTYDAETDSVTITAKGLKEFAGKNVIN